MLPTKSSVATCCTSRSFCTGKRKREDSETLLKLREYNRAYYQAHREKRIEQQRTYQAENLDKVVERQKLYRQQNFDKLQQASKCYYEQNKPEIAEKRRRYYEDKKKDIVAREKEYYSQNPEKRLEKFRKCYHNKRSKVASQLEQEVQTASKELRKNFEAYLGIKSLEDWYQVNSRNFGGNSKLREMTNHFTLPVLLKTKKLYPEAEWTFGRLKRCPKEIWDDPNEVRKFLTYLESHFLIQNFSDWSKVPHAELKQMAHGMMKKFGTLQNILLMVYPSKMDEIQKSFQKGNSAKKSTQRLLSRMLREFTELDIHEDFTHPELTWDDRKHKKHITFDIWVPAFNMAIEYQGEPHYKDYNFFSQPSKVYHENDKQKKKLCQQNCIALVEVPYWWDKTFDSLQTILAE